NSYRPPTRNRPPRAGHTRGGGGRAGGGGGGGGGPGGGRRGPRTSGAGELDCALAACGLLVWQLVDFMYADIGGPSTVLTAVALGGCAWWGLRPRDSYEECETYETYETHVAYEACETYDVGAPNVTAGAR
ncbi:hypothetical protein ACFVZ2_20495, partial [Streptomyces lasiicapitis]